MKKISIVFFMALLVFDPACAQVGINTEDPQASLDINGDLRIRTVPIDNTSSSILVLDTNNMIHQNITLLSNNAARSFVEATGGSSITLLSATLLSGWNKIPFSNEELDEHNDYDNTNNYEFTAPQSGVYSVYVQFEVTGLVSAGEIGVGIFKRAAGASTYTLLAQESYVTVSVAGINVSPLTRKSQRLVKLANGDHIAFGAKVPLLTVTLIGGSKSFFTIEQVK